MPPLGRNAKWSEDSGGWAFSNPNNLGLEEQQMTSWQYFKKFLTQAALLEPTDYSHHPQCTLNRRHRLPSFRCCVYSKFADTRQESNLSSPISGVCKPLHCFSAKYKELN